MKKRLFCTLIIALMMALLTVTASAATATGTCGAEGYSVTWSLTNDGTLTISGNGPMKDFSDSPPWAGYADSITHVEVKNGVTRIGMSAFESFTALKTANLAASVKEIGMYAFIGSGLIDFPEAPGVETIDDYAFASCKSIIGIDLPEGLKSIGYRTFYNCTDASYVIIPSTIENITYEAFYQCKYLNQVHVADLAAWCALDFAPPYYTGGTYQGNPLWYSNALYLNGVKVTDLVIPEGVTELGNYVFVGASFNSITLPSSLKQIGSIGPQTFVGTDIYISDLAAWCAVEKKDYLWAHDLYLNGGKVTDLVIPTGITSLGKSAFDSCKSIESVSIPSSVTTIGDYAFYSCSALAEATLSQGLTKIGAGAFDSTALSEITIPASVSEVGLDAFAYLHNTLKTVTFEGCPATIGSTAFRYATADVYYPVDHAGWTADKMQNYGATSLTWVRPNPSGTCGAEGDNVIWEFDPETGVLTISGEDEMADCVGENNPWHAYLADIKAVVVGDGVTSIGSCAFQDCVALQSVDLPDTLDTIGIFAFDGCSSLQTIALPDSLTFIGDDAFFECISLQEITIPAKVRYVGQYAFYDCTALETVTFEGSAPTFGEDAFLNVGTAAAPAAVYYRAGNASWTASKRQNYGGNLNWQSYCPNHNDSSTDGDHRCDSCGEIMGEHSFTVTGRTEPTCGENGVITSVCDCGYTSHTTLPATGLHRYDNGFCTAGCNGYEPCGGSGTAEDPYTIGNAGQLYWYAAVVDEGYGERPQHSYAAAVLVDDIVVNENVLDEDGELKEGTYLDWTPIMKGGAFDGRNHTISGLYVNWADRGEDGSRVGLFGSTNYPVSNVGIVDSYFYGYSLVGAIAGYINDDLTNCWSNSRVVGEWYVGGIAGEIYSSFAYVTGCSNSGHVSGCGYVGGIIGHSSCYNGVGITDCSNSGTIESEGESGGIAGRLGGDNSTVDKCQNTGHISGSSWVGGIVGSSGGSTQISCCYNTGDISGTEYVGGIAGTTSLLDACYNTGMITGNLIDCTGWGDYVHMFVGAIAGECSTEYTDFGNELRYLANGCYYLEGTCDYGIGWEEILMMNPPMGGMGEDGEPWQPPYDYTEYCYAEEFASGEVCWNLASYCQDDSCCWGQNIDNGQPVQAYPVFSDAAVYCVETCNGDWTYSNTNENKDHVFSSDNDHVCDVCREMIGDHKYESVVTDATCTEDGEKTFTCGCGDSYTEPIPALGHKYSEEVTQAPTCTENGEVTFTCGTCGDTYTEEIVTEGHNADVAVQEHVIPATCVAGGSYDNVVYCTICEAELSRETVTTGMLPHSFTNYVPDNNGLKTAVCDNLCGASETRVDEKYTEPEIKVTPNVMEEGKAETSVEKDLLDEIADYEKNLYVNSEIVKMIFNNSALKKLLKDFDEAVTISIVAKDTTPENASNKLVFDVYVSVDGEDQEHTYFGENEGKVTVTVPMSKLDVPVGKRAYVYYVDGDTRTLVDSKYVHGGSTIEFVTDHFSTYEVLVDDCFDHECSYEADKCTICGAAKPADPVPMEGDIRLRSATLEMKEMIAILYKASEDSEADADPTKYANVAERGVLLYKTAELAATRDPAKAFETVILGYKASEGRYVGRTAGISAKDMGNVQYAVAYMKMTDGSYIFGTKEGADQVIEYSPRQYCENMVGKSTTSAEVKQLCHAMMQYGAAAQVDQLKQTTGLMNEGFAAVPYDESVLGEEKFSVNKETVNGLTLKSATLELKGAMSYLVKCTADTTLSGKALYMEYTLEKESGTRTGSVEMVYNTGEGRWVATIRGISAKDMGATLTVKPYYVDENGEKVYGGELVYSAYEYVRRAQTNTSFAESTKELSRALAMYVHYANIFGYNK